MSITYAFGEQRKGLFSWSVESMWAGVGGDETRQVHQVQVGKGLEYHLKECGFILEGVLAEDF